MQPTARQSLLQIAHVLQQEMFPALRQELGPLNEASQLVASILALTPVGGFVQQLRSGTGRRPKDRAAIASALIAKAVLNLATTRDLIERLRVDESLRRLCGWRQASEVPHESKFSRVFEQFATSELPQRLHAALIAQTQSQRLIGHISRDSTAVQARERFPELQQEGSREHKGKRPVSQAGGKNQRSKKGRPRRAKASERGTRIQRQQHMNLAAMLAELPRSCDLGVKTSSGGNQQYWRGYKLHLDVADGQIPISALLTSASVHDSQAAIPLMQLTSSRVTYLYELMDSAYDADELLRYSRQRGHVPIVTPHSRRGTKKPSQVPKARPAKPARELNWAEADRMKERTSVERVYARLKDEFGLNQVRVRGAAKVMAHAMFGVLALTVDQWLRLAPTG